MKTTPLRLLLLIACLAIAVRAEEEEEEEDGYEEIDSGRIAHAQCTAFTVETTLDSNTTAILDATGIFHVPQAAYMFYDYSGSNDDSSYSTSMMVELDEWVESMASVKGSAAPNCTLIENGRELFNDNRKVQALYGHQYSDDYTPGLYEGPICGMGSDKPKVVVGVFLDEYCTLFAPKLMYKYRKMVNKGKAESNIKATIDVVAAASKKTLSCKKYEFCGQLLGNSVSTQFCDQNGGRRFLEDVAAEENDEEGNEEAEQGDTDAEQDENADDQGDQYNEDANNQYDIEASNNSTNSWYNNVFNGGTSNKPADYSLGSYQLSQNDLYNMGTTCYAAVTSMNEGVTLESYLTYHGVLRTKDPKTAAQIVKMITLIALSLISFVLCVTNVKIRRVKKIKVQEKEIEMASDSDSSAASGTFVSMDDQEEETLESGTFATATYATMETGVETSASPCMTEASTMQGQLWQDLKAAKEEFKAAKKDFFLEDQGQEIQRVTTPMVSNAATPRKKTWPLSLTHARTPDDAKMPLVTESDEGLMKFSPPPFFKAGGDDNDTPFDEKKSSWRPSFRTGGHRGSSLKKVNEENV